MIRAHFPSLAGLSTGDRKGASMIIHDDQKNCIVIDGGEGILLTRTLQYLHSKGITHVTSILTHWHPDHDRGLRGLLESDIIVDKIYCPPIEEVRKLDSDDYSRGSKIIALAKSLKKTIVNPKPGMWSEYRCGEMRFQIYRRAANTSDYADYRVNNTSMSTFFPDLLTLDNGDTIRVAEAVKNISGTPIFFVIPHHGNACNTSAANAMKQKGAKICYYTNPEPYVGGTGFTATGAKRTKEVGILTLGCMKEVTVEYDNKKMTIRQGINTYVYNIPYSSGAWEKTPEGKWKYKKDGKYLTGSQQIAGAWYYFDDDGIMQTGLVTRGRYTYWYDLKTGTLTKNTWISDGHYWRYFDEWGQAKTGWFQDPSSKKWCYLDRDTKGGKLVAEWFHDPFQKCWYRLDEKGWMVKDGVHDVEGKRYRFDNYGRTVTADGKLANSIEAAKVNDDPIDRVITLAKSEVGYTEKASAASLDSKTANAGSGNYTKYGKEMHSVYPSTMDYPAAWCDCFVDWLFYKCFGKDKAMQMLCGRFDDYTYNSVGLYKNAGRWYSSPKRGDQIFFGGSGHTGIVTDVKDGIVYTIEGNAGNAVRAKKYSTKDSSIIGYGRPRYELA